MYVQYWVSHRFGSLVAWGIYTYNQASLTYEIVLKFC